MPSTLGEIYLGSTLVASGKSGSGAEWIRPADWLSLPNVVATDQVFYGLVAIHDAEANPVAIRCSGAYTVDWGDGTTANIASGTTAEKNYSYSSTALSGTLTERGYKQAVVKITPQTGQALSSIDLSFRHSLYSATADRSTKWLDIKLAMNNAGVCTTYTFGSNGGTHLMLENFDWVGTNSQTNFLSFLRGSIRLRSFSMSTVGGINFNSFLRDCGIAAIPLHNTESGLDFTSYALNCTFLTELPSLVLTAGTTFSNFALNTTNVTKISCLFPANRDINIANKALGPAALNAIYGNLPTASGSPRIITVTGNWGISSHTPTIATNKGWTVTT